MKSKNPEQTTAEYSPVVKYHNDLNGVIMRKWSVTEMDFFFSVIATVKEKGCQVVEFDREQITSLAGWKDPNKKRLVSTLRSLRSHVSNMEILQCRKEGIWNIEESQHLFESFKIQWTDDMSDFKLTVKVNNDFEYLVNMLNTDFTVFQLEEFTQIRSTYAKNLYRLLKQFRTTGWRTFKKDEFFTLMSIPPKYTSSHVIQKVLEPCKRELIKYFEDFNYKTVTDTKKKGHPVIGYSFTWKPEKARKAVLSGKGSANDQNHTLNTNDFLTPSAVLNASDPNSGTAWRAFELINLLMDKNYDSDKVYNLMMVGDWINDGCSPEQITGAVLAQFDKWDSFKQLDKYMTPTMIFNRSESNLPRFDSLTKSRLPLFNSVISKSFKIQNKDSDEIMELVFGAGLYLALAGSGLNWMVQNATDPEQEIKNANDHLILFPSPRDKTKTGNFHELLAEFVQRPLSRYDLDLVDNYATAFGVDLILKVMQDLYQYRWNRFLMLSGYLYLLCSCGIIDEYSRSSRQGELFRTKVLESARSDDTKSVNNFCRDLEDEFHYKFEWRQGSYQRPAQEQANLPEWYDYVPDSNDKASPEAVQAILDLQKRVLGNEDSQPLTDEELKKMLEM